MATIEPPINQGIRNVKAIPVSFCSEESRFVQVDSRVVHIPRKVWKEFIKRKSSHKMDSVPLYVGIRKSGVQGGKCFFFGHVEFTTNTSNSSDDMALLPDWLFDHLGSDPMDTNIDIVYVPMPQDVDKIVLKGDNSSYVHTDVRSEIENKIGKWNCINKDESFNVGGVKFTVLDLRTKTNDDLPTGRSVNFASIYDLKDVKLEFEEPDDIKAAREREEKRIKQEEEWKSRPVQKAKVEISYHADGKHFGAHVSGFNHEEQKNLKPDNHVFQGDGLKIGGTQSLPKTKQEMLEARLKRLAELEKQG